MTNNKLYGITFLGNEASDYAKENGYLDYATLSKAFDAVLNNDIIRATSDIGYWEQESGFVDNSEEIEELNERIEEIDDRQSELIDGDAEETEEYEILQNELEELQEKIEELEEETGNDEIYQYYIISNNGAEILKYWTNEIVFYNEELNMYVWGVTHLGTRWDYVLTDIKLNCKEETYR